MAYQNNQTTEIVFISQHDGLHEFEFVEHLINLGSHDDSFIDEFVHSSARKECVTLLNEPLSVCFTVQIYMCQYAYDTFRNAMHNLQDCIILCILVNQFRECVFEDSFEHVCVLSIQLSKERHDVQQYHSVGAVDLLQVGNALEE